MTFNHDDWNASNDNDPLGSFLAIWIVLAAFVALIGLLYVILNAAGATQ